MKPAQYYRPQKALLVDTPPVGDRWIHELKLDGFRMGVFIGARQVQIISRRGRLVGIERPITEWTCWVIPALIFWPSFDSPVMSNKCRIALSFAGSNFSAGAAGAVAAVCPG